jgi:nicotinamide-nucleotide amidase
VIERLDREPGVTLAFLASGLEGIRIRLTAKAPDRKGAVAQIARVEEEITALLGRLIFGMDDETMEEVVLRLLVARGLRLAISDGATGGLLSHRLESCFDQIPEARSTFVGAVVSPAASARDGVEAMAAGIANTMQCDLGLSLLAEIQPGSDGGRPVGILKVGTHLRDQSGATEVRLPGNPDQLRRFACISALNFLRLTLLDSEGSLPIS